MTGRKILTEADFELMATMRAAGKSYAQIGRKLGCSGSAVSWHVLRLGIDGPRPPKLQPGVGATVCTRGGFLVRRFTLEEDRLITQLALQGAGNSAIAHRLGRRPNSVLGRLMTLARYEEHGIAWDQPVASHG